MKTDTLQFKAFKGLRNDTDQERFGPEDLAVAQNVDIDSTGRIARRAGQTEVYNGNAHSLFATADARRAYFVESNALKELSTAYAATTLRSGLTAARMRYLEVAGRVYYSNAYETGVIDNGLSRSWGLVPPLNPGVATASGGNLPDGVYQYTLTYIRKDGQESGAPLARKVTVTEGGITWASLPVSADPDVTHKMLYLSTADGEVLYRAVTLTNATTTAAYAGDGTDLQVPLDTQFMQEAPTGQVLAYWRGHVFVAVGNIVFVSEPYGYELFDLRNYLPFPTRVTLICPVDDGIYFADEGGHWFATGEPKAMALSQKTEYGAIPDTLRPVRPEIFGDGSTQGAVAIWTTPEGIIAGRNGGVLTNLSKQYTHPAAVNGASLFRDVSGLHQYLVTLRT